MSLSVPQNGVKPDNEPVIELFVKVSPPPPPPPGGKFPILSKSPPPARCDDSSLEVTVMSAAPSSLLPWKHVWFLHQAETVKWLLNFGLLTSPGSPGAPWPCAARRGALRADSGPRPHRVGTGCHAGKTDRCFSNKSPTVLTPR